MTPSVALEQCTGKLRREVTHIRDLCLRIINLIGILSEINRSTSPIITVPNSPKTWIDETAQKSYGRERDPQEDDDGYRIPWIHTRSTGTGWYSNLLSSDSLQAATWVLQWVQSAMVRLSSAPSEPAGPVCFAGRRMGVEPLSLRAGNGSWNNPVGSLLGNHSWMNRFPLSFQCQFQSGSIKFDSTFSWTESGSVTRCRSQSFSEYGRK
jgi:hypothetical protein